MASPVQDKPRVLAEELDAALAGLTDKRRAFAEEVALGVPQTEAARRAGYQGKHLSSIASRLMADEAIQRAIAALLAVNEEAAQPTDRDWIKRTLRQIALMGTSAARVSALQALERILERENPKPVDAERTLGQDGLTMLHRKILERLLLLAEHFAREDAIPTGFPEAEWRTTWQRLADLAPELSTRPRNQGAPQRNLHD